MRISYLSEKDRLYNLNTTDEIELSHKIVLVDLDWVTPERFKQLQESTRIHIGYITSPQIVGWHRDHRNAVLHYMNGAYAATEYLKNQLAFLDIQIGLLPYPIGVKSFKPAKKEKTIAVIGEPIVVNGKKDHAHNIDQVSLVFQGLKEFGFTGTIMPVGSANLFSTLAEAWGFIDMSRSSRLPLEFIIAGFCGCWNFVWSYHGYADKYPIHRFNNVDHAVEQINECYESSGGVANKDFRKYMTSLHGFSAFEKKLKSIVNQIIFE